MIEEIVKQIERLSTEPGLPKNVRQALQNAKEELLNEEKELPVRISSAVYELEKTIDEPNLMQHTRIALLQIISTLESIRDQ
ncbi:MAG: hypothetical protein GXN92_02000 [Candidatus Micrarchaeota archaeon]|nr:hypothetical protein [Candidatus Micrarchaeota archaeon]